MECRGLLALCVCTLVASSAATDSFGAGMKILGRMYDNCERSQEVVKCFKIQAARLVDRAARMDTLNIMDGISMTRRSESGRSFAPILPAGDLSSLGSEQVDRILESATSRLLESHRLNVSPGSVGGDVGRSINEARSRLRRLIGPILTALAIKGGFVAMAFQTIAVIAGKALLIGKIALVLSAIIGLKKLVSGGEAHEKTTYEIVKHPQVSQSHTYSASHYGGGGEFEGTGPGGHYRRSVEDEQAAQDRAYRAHTRH